MSLGSQLSAIAGAMIAQFGDAVTVNGQATKAFFNRLDVARVQADLEEGDWNSTVYEVELLAAVFQSPYNLKADSKIAWSKRGWRLTVRRLPDAPGLNDADLSIKVIAVVTPKD